MCIKFISKQKSCIQYNGFEVVSFQCTQHNSCKNVIFPYPIVKMKTMNLLCLEQIQSKRSKSWLKTVFLCQKTAPLWGTLLLKNNRYFRSSEIFNAVSKISPAPTMHNNLEQNTVACFQKLSRVLLQNKIRLLLFSLFIHFHFS